MNLWLWSSVIRFHAGASFIFAQHVHVWFKACSSATVNAQEALEPPDLSHVKDSFLDVMANRNLSRDEQENWMNSHNLMSISQFFSTMISVALSHYGGILTMEARQTQSPGIYAPLKWNPGICLRKFCFLSHESKWCIWELGEFMRSQQLNSSAGGPLGSWACLSKVFISMRTASQADL